MTLGEIIDSGGGLQPVRDFLQTLSIAQRVRACQSLKPQQIHTLWESAADVPLVDVEELIPAKNETFVYALKNTLPLFSCSEKRFFRSEEDALGYNQTDALATFFAGPGYFRVRRDPTQGVLVFDYVDLPETVPDTWPPLVDNATRIRKLVYGGMIDYIRVVAPGTFVGHPYRGEKAERVRFLITRST